jgi:hypothetical protein
MTSEELKQTTSMRDVLDRYGVKVGRNGMCCCPIHGERHASMKVYPDGFKCFACGAGGDIFDFVEAMENVDFKTAFGILGGTYDKNINKATRTTRNVKFGRQKAERQRQEKADKEFRKLLEDAIFDLRYMIANNEPYMQGEEVIFPDDWCFGQDRLPYLEYIFEEIYINENEGVKKANVIRMCQRIRRRTNHK